MFSVSELTIEQDNRPLWQNFSFELPAGERLGISAPSGYGKTMLGRVLAGWQSCRQGGSPLTAFLCQNVVIVRFS